MRLRCLVIDDEKPAREGLADYVGRIDFLQLAAVCQSAIEANQIIRKEPIDLVFLDIHMPDLSGIDWLRSLSEWPLVIFTTAYREFALEGYELNAVDYLVKPIAFPRFVGACNKALERWQSRQITPSTPTDDYIFIKVDHQLIKVRFSDICFLEAAGDYVHLHTASSGRYLTLLTLRQIESQLPQPPFLRTHRSFIVNKDFVHAIEGNQVVIGTHKVPISRSAYKEVFESIIGGKLWRKGE